jgi:hypothetical protein
MSTTRRVASRAKGFVRSRTPALQARRTDATPIPSSIKGDDRSRPPPRVLKPSDVRVIYTDKNLTVLSKPSGLVCQPDASTPVLCLLFPSSTSLLTLPQNGLELAYSGKHVCLFTVPSSWCSLIFQLSEADSLFHEAHHSTPFIASTD